MLPLLLLAAPPSSAAEPWAREGWGFGGVPAVNYNADEGFGFGVVGSIYRYDGESRPYKTALSLILFATTEAVQTHNLEVDALALGSRPIRLTSKVEFAATKTSNYCGIGPEVTCDPALAGDDEHFYRTQFLNPNAQVNVRWAVDPKPHLVELFFGYRASAMIPGDLKSAEPYPGSLYDQDFPGGERGLVSGVQVGVSLDDRDNEPAPIRGYWIEGSVRAASFVLGSDYEHVGFDTTLRGYVPLGTDRLVLADRLMFDGLVGDAHTVELANPGGLQRYTFYGSFNAGRGIRLRRYIGKVKAMEQAELRWTYASPVIAKVPVDLGVLAFVDVGFVGEDFSGLDAMFSHPLPGVGGGLRFAFDQNFIIRADVGVSPIEDWAPAVYIDIKNLF